MKFFIALAACTLIPWNTAWSFTGDCEKKYFLSGKVQNKWISQEYIETRGEMESGTDCSDAIQVPDGNTKIRMTLFKTPVRIHDQFNRTDPDDAECRKCRRDRTQWTATFRCRWQLKRKPAGKFSTGDTLCFHLEQDQREDGDNRK